jgi:hypothetical protein
MSSLPKTPPTPEIPEHFTRMNKQGLIEVVDYHTGRVICVQSSAEDLLLGKFERLTLIKTPQGDVWIEKGINFDILPTLRGEPFSEVLSDLICEKVVNGMALVKACQEMGLEYSTICRWRREHPGFLAKLDQAKKDRAEFLHDEMLERARHSRTSARTHIEALQYAAEKGNPEVYAPKTPQKGEMQGNITFVIQTGIDRTAVLPAEPKDVTPLVPAATEKDEIVIPEIG